MSDTYRVRVTDSDGRQVGPLSYPVDAEWDAKLRAAAAEGPEAASAMRRAAEASGGFKTVGPGDDCSDLPAQSLGWLLEQGLIEAVSDESEVRSTAEALRDLTAPAPSKRAKGRKKER